MKRLSIEFRKLSLFISLLYADVGTHRVSLRIAWDVSRSLEPLAGW